jgi:hypothetical protein
MRNIFEHPFTYAETKAVLEKFAESVSYKRTGLIGDTRPSIIGHLIDNFDELWYKIYCGRDYFEGPAKRE